MNLIEEKKSLFRDAVRHAFNANEKLLAIMALPELCKTLTDEQREAIDEYREALRRLKSVAQDLEAGRSE